MMPRKPKKPCAYIGCSKLTDKMYCSEHEKIERKKYDKYFRRSDIGKKYGRVWKRIRDSYVKEHPLCELCLEEGRYIKAQEVHHKLPVSQGGTHERSNLMALCKSCHNKEHIKLGDRKVGERV